jgi:excisionase family DNA binding protein
MRLTPRILEAPLTPIGAASEILTVHEVAIILRCSKAHVHNLIAGRVKGLIRLPAIQLGRRRLVRKKSLTEWLALNESRVAMIRSSLDVDAADA